MTSVCLCTLRENEAGRIRECLGLVLFYKQKWKIHTADKFIESDVTGVYLIFFFVLMVVQKSFLIKFKLLFVTRNVTKAQMFGLSHQKVDKMRGIFGLQI